MSKKVVLEQLRARISKSGDFPILSKSLHTAVAMMDREDCDFSALVQIVLSDFALTQKVLRLANSVMYRVFGRDITTVSRALMVIGTDTIVHLVIGLKILEHFHDNASRRVEAGVELNRAVLSSCIARALTIHDDALAAEEAVVCTLMRQTGRLLVAVYLDAEWDQIRTQVEAGADDAQACEAVLGATFEDIGLEVASFWRLPAVIRSGMTAFDPDATDEQDHAQRLRAISSYSIAVTDVLTHQSLSDAQRDASIASLASQYGEALDVDPSELAAASVTLALEGAGAPVLREIAELHANTAVNSWQTLDPQARIVAGTNDLRVLATTAGVEPALTLACETVSEALDCARTVAFVLDDRGVFRARVGFGAQIEERLPALSFSSVFEPDVFHLAITNSVGILISDAHTHKKVARLPEWYRQAIEDAHSFVLLPVVGSHKSTVALLYCDWSEAQQRRKVSRGEMTALNELARELGRTLCRSSGSGGEAPDPAWNASSGSMEDTNLVPADS